MNIQTDRPEYAHVGDMLFKHQLRIAKQHFKSRHELISKLKTKEDWQRRKEWARRTFTEMIGGLPERTDLNPRIVGVIEKDDYRIEKLIFESRPQFYVTANVYTPKEADFPAPAVLNPLGHWTEGKVTPDIQARCIGLAKKGFIALVYDPLGQGERSQYWDSKKNRSKVGRSVNEHTWCGNQCILTGVNLAQYRVWDGTRAIDYLFTRDDVDKERIGCTGASGGGTLTTYLTCLEPRITVSAPVCYVNSRERWLETGGIADPEQNPINSLRDGLEHADLLIPILPGALQIIAAIHDFFPIRGTRETYEELKRAWRAYGVEEKLNLVEIDSQHAYNKQMREAMYAWFNKWLAGKDGEGTEPEMGFEPAENLWCTKTGQVMPSLGGATVFTMNAAYAEKIAPKQKALKSKDECVELQERVKKAIVDLLAYSSVETPLNAATLGAEKRDGYTIEKVAFNSDEDIIIPSLLFLPKNRLEGRPLTVCVHEDGKDASLYEGSPVLSLVDEGYVVLAIDVRGRGETSWTRKDGRGDYDSLLGREANLAYNGYMLGRPLFGMRVLDVVRSVDYLTARDDARSTCVVAIGEGVGGLYAMYAAALDDRIRGVISNGVLTSYKSLATHELYAHNVSAFLPGVLKRYELHDVAATIAPRPLLLANPVDHAKKALSLKAAKREFSTTISAYKALDAEGALSVVTFEPHEAARGIYSYWLQYIE